MKNRIVVIGAGISGVGAAVLAKEKGFEVFVSDKGIITNENKTVLLNNEIEWEESNHTLDKIINANEVIKSPGIADTVDLIQILKQKSIPVISEVEFAFRYTKAKIAAITGSNGKTTTTLLLGHVLENAGYDVLVAGNIGVGFALSIAERDYDYVVLELSSFQLDGIQDFRSDVAIVLNITPDHLDRYDYNLKNYTASKFRITENQTTQDVLIYNADDAMMNALVTKAKKLPISLKNKQTEGGFYNNNEIKITEVSSNFSFVNGVVLSVNAGVNLTSTKLTSDGGYIAVGRLNDSSTSSVDDGYFIKYDSSGIAEITKNFSTLLSDMFFYVDIIPSGGYYFAGIVLGSENDTSNDYDFYVVKVDAQGNRIF